MGGYGSDDCNNKEQDACFNNFALHILSFTYFGIKSIFFISV
jgi:hypothetical protein